MTKTYHPPGPGHPNGYDEDDGDPGLFTKIYWTASAIFVLVIIVLAAQALHDSQKPATQPADPCVQVGNTC